MAKTGRLGEIIPLKEEVISKACSEAIKAHKSPEKLFAIEKSSEAVFISFPGFWSVNDWFSGDKPFGETKIDLKKLPSLGPLRSTGNDEVALVNEAFLKRFTEKIIGNPEFLKKVNKAAEGNRKIVFTGHSTGGSIAVLATIWFLERYRKPNTNTNTNTNTTTNTNTSAIAYCVTFGCPLTGNHIFSHALRRENWAQYFLHFVMKYDIVPRILLAPKSSIENELSSILQYYSSKSKDIPPKKATDLYTTVMRKASSVASQSACTLMRNTNLLSETVTSFIQLSPYRPFGTYIFCSGNGKLSVTRNTNSVLQILFYSSQLSSEATVEEVALKSIQKHLSYKDELTNSSNMQNVVDLDKWEDLPLSADANDKTVINIALNDLGLGTSARLGLSAAIDHEKQKDNNIEKKLNSKKDAMRKFIKELQDYKEFCRIRKVGYYDSFKLQNNVQDFQANVNRLNLAGIWDEIMELLKKYELPDEFEGKEDWITEGTTFRRLVEPLDIANYYRHTKNQDTDSYMGDRGRPKRYRYTQRWLEHERRGPAGSCGESCVLAHVEQFKIKMSSGKTFENIQDDVEKLEKDVKKWVDEKVLDEEDVFLENSTFTQWWKTLPASHREKSCIRELIKTE